MAMMSGSTQTEMSYSEMFNRYAPVCVLMRQPSTPASPGNRLLKLRQAVVELDPVHLLRDPDVLARGKGVAIVEDGQRDADHGAVGAAGKQPRAAGLAEHAVERVRRWIARGFAFHRQGALVEQRAGEERRSHRLLAGAAMADPDIERLAFGFEPHRAAQASAFSGHGVPDFNKWPVRRRYRTPRRWRTRSLRRPATPPSRRALPPARNVLSEFSTA